MPDLTPMTEPLMRQKEAAAFLGVSVNWLRASDCPKVLLPGQGVKGHPVIRYNRADLLEWRESWSTKQRAG